MSLSFDATFNNEDVMRKVRETQKAFAELGNTAEMQGRRIDAAFEKISLKSLERMLEIMKNFPKEVQGISSFQKQINETEKQIERVNQRIASVGSGKLAPTFTDTSSNINIGDTLKQQIFEGSQAINTLSEKIIQQKILIKDVEGDIRALGEAYKRAGEGTTRGNALFGDFASAKKALQEEKNALFELQTQQAQARLSVRKLKDEQTLYQKETQNVVGSNDNMALSFKKALGVIGGVTALKQLGSEIIKVRGEFQAMQTAIETLVGKDMAANLIPQIKELAKVSPLTLSDMVGAEKMMLGFNIKAEDTIRYLQALGDISMGNSQKFNSLTLAFSQMSATGKLMGQDLNQMINSGFNPLQTISEKTGKSIATLKEEMSQGAISTEMVQKAFIDATSEGGRFFGMSENASKTINGQLSMMRDALDEVFNEIGTKGEGAIMSGIQATTSLIQNYETIGKILTGLIGTYGLAKAALFLYTETTKGYTIAQTLATSATIVWEKAQKALNLSVLKNPYVLAIVTVGTLITSMWALHDSTTAAEKAQNKFNDELDKFKQKEEERKQKIESLIRTIQDETETEFAKVKAYEELQRLSPTLTDAYKREELAVASLADTTKELNKVRDMETYDNIIANIKKYTEYVNRLSKPGDKMKNVGDIYSEMVSEYGVNTTFKDRQELAIEDLNKWKDYLNEYNRLKKEAEEDVKPIKVKLLEAENNREQIVQEYAAAKLTLEEEERKIKDSGFGVIPIDIQLRFDNAKAQLANIDTTIASLIQSKSTQTYKEAYETAKREWKAAQKALEESKKKSKADYDVAKKDLDEKEKNFKDLGGVTNTTKQESAADKLRKQQESIREQQDKNAQLEKKQSLDRQRQQQDLENQAAQAEIDSLEDSFEKKQAQRELNNKKEIQALERQKEDYINAVIQFEKEKFDAQEDLKAKEDPKHVKKTFDSSTVKVDTSAFDGIIGNTSKKQLNDKVREQEESWNEYLIKFGNYQQKRVTIIEKYDKLIKEAEDAGKAATYEKDKQNAIDDLDNSIKNSTTLMGQLFADASQKSASEIQKVIEKAELLMQYLGSAKDEKGNAQIGGKTVSKQDILGLGISDNTLQNLESSTDEVESLRNAIDRLKGDLGSKSPFKLFETQIETAVKKIAQGGKKNIAQGITEIGEAVVAFSPAVSQFGKDLGNIFGSDELGNKIAGISDSIGGLGQTAAGVGQIMSGDIVGGAMSAVNGISAIVGALDGLFGADYSQYNKMKGEYDSLNNVWDQLISKKQEYIDISYGDEARKTAKELEDLYNKKMQSNIALGKERLNSGASKGSHSIGVRQRKDMSETGWNELKQAATNIGFNFWPLAQDRMEGLFDLSADQLAKLQEQAPTFWAKLDGDVQEYLQNIIDCNGEIEDMNVRLNETFTGVSWDSFYDGFVSTLTDMDKDSKDVADNFGEYLKNAIIENLVANKYREKIKALYDDWAKKSDSDGDGVFDLTPKESAELKEAQKLLAEQIIAERDAMADTFGWTGESSSTSQNSTQQGFESMSQDTGNELNGRFTALQVSNEEIKNSMLAMLTGVNLISTTTASNGITLSEIRNIALMSNSHLEDIARFTKPLLEVGGKLDRIESNTKGLVSR